MDKKKEVNSDPINGVYTVRQLAQKLELNERTIGDLLRSGELKGYKKIGKWFIFKDDLIKYLKS